MKEYKSLQCDVLVLGGGIAGLTAATEIKEHNPDVDVLVVEKNFAGYAGKANRGGGVLQYFDLTALIPSSSLVSTPMKSAASSPISPS